MVQGSKDAYTDKQKRKARHIEESYEKKGVSENEAERRAWATVNKDDGGGKKSGSGRGKKSRNSASRKGGKKGSSRRQTRH
jgi:plasmid stabilization system protein ParE